MLQTELMAISPPPRPGFYQRLAKPLFGTPLNAVISLVCLWLFWVVVKAAWGWLVTRAVTEGGGAVCRAGSGVCLPFLAAKARFMIFGVYPYDEHWRPALSMTLFFIATGVSMMPR